MRNELGREEQLRAARQLALHLRQTPEDAQRAPDDLAAQFGLPATFVANVLSGVEGRARKAEPWFPKFDFSFIVRAYNWIDRQFERLIANPVLFVMATTVLVGVISFLSESSTQVRVGPQERGLSIQSLVVLVSALLVFGLHIIVFFKKRMVRYAMLSGLGLWLGISVFAMISVWLQVKTEPGQQAVIGGLLLLVAFGMFVVCSIYAAIGAGAAVLGAYLEMLRIKLREDRMSRQELLEHYFHLQERLDASRGLAPKPSIFDSEFAKALLNTGPLWALLTGLVLSSLTVFITIASGVNVGTQTNPTWPVYAVMLLSVITLIANVLAGFFAKNLWYAVLHAIAFTAGSVPPIILGIQAFDVQRLQAGLEPLQFFLTLAGRIIVALFGAIGGLVQRRTSKELNLAQNDPATILAEMVRIQWKLSDRRSYLCVMVVDAAKSAEMKSYADPLAVEYSFREYQNLLTELASDLHGRVHSTAGDGAVIAFESAQEAFTAAKRIQTDIERFNREDNRLQLPFRLRIGLHMGEIVGELDEVEYTEVIDIAAHVQAAAPVGGIAVTEEVANYLPIEEFIPLAKQIDGQNVMLALNPTMDPQWQSFKI
ncbi:MAG TPA: adenylate/guanylate cyclase domain-containing protein [Fimbriimonadaceae bacterium]|nr:adenylate/guanylate cyclase domain-containing protein [Fimbriimonadaceae bacterium]